MSLLLNIDSYIYPLNAIYVNHYKQLFEKKEKMAKDDKNLSFFAHLFYIFLYKTPNVNGIIPDKPINNKVKSEPICLTMILAMTGVSNSDTPT